MFPENQCETIKVRYFIANVSRMSLLELTGLENKIKMIGHDLSLILFLLKNKANMIALILFDLKHS